MTSGEKSSARANIGAHQSKKGSESAERGRRQTARLGSLCLNFSAAVRKIHAQKNEFGSLPLALNLTDGAKQ